MNKTRTLLPLVAGLLAVCLPSLRAADLAPLINFKFDAPNLREVIYPPETGGKFQEVAMGCAGWASGGQIQLTYGHGYGLDSTGGIYVQILKDAKFYQINFTRIKFPMLKDSYSMREPIQTMQVTLDAKIPVGKSFEVHLGIDLPKGIEPPESVWNSRLILGTVVGTGEYTSYSFSGTEISEKIVSNFIRYIRGCYLNGMLETAGTLTFHLDPGQWLAGDEFLLDNVGMAIVE